MLMEDREGQRRGPGSWTQEGSPLHLFPHGLDTDDQPCCCWWPDSQMVQVENIKKGTDTPCKMGLRANWPMGGGGGPSSSPQSTCSSPDYGVSVLQSSRTSRSPRGNLSALQVTTPVKSLQNGVSPLWTFRPGGGPHAWSLFLSKHPSLQPFCSCHKSLHQSHTLPSDCSLCFLGLTPAFPGRGHCSPWLLWSLRTCSEICSTFVNTTELPALYSDSACGPVHLSRP